MLVRGYTAQTLGRPVEPEDTARAPPPAPPVPGPVEEEVTPGASIGVPGYQKRKAVRPKIRLIETTPEVTPSGEDETDLQPLIERAKKRQLEIRAAAAEAPVAEALPPLPPSPQPSGQGTTAEGSGIINLPLGYDCSCVLDASNDDIFSVKTVKLSGSSLDATAQQATVPSSLPSGGTDIEMAAVEPDASEAERLINPPLSQYVGILI